MSFILDALRKVDREAQTTQEVAPPVAVVEKLRKEKRNRRHQLAAMAAIGVVSAAATTLLLRRPPPPEPAPAPIAVTARPAVEASAGVEEPAIEPLTVEEPMIETAPAEAPPEDATPVEAPIPEPVQVAEAEAEPPPPSSNDEAIPDAQAAAPAQELPQLVLQGTSVLAGKPVAVVSDRRVFEGDIVEGALVLRIEERLVELEFDGRRFTLTF